MTTITFPAELSGVIPALQGHAPGGNRDVDRLRSAIVAGWGFDSRWPLRLQRWCERRGVECSGPRACAIAATGFQGPGLWRLGAILRAVALIRAAEPMAVPMAQPMIWAMDDPRPAGPISWGAEDRARRELLYGGRRSEPLPAGAGAGGGGGVGGGAAGGAPARPARPGLGLGMPRP